MRTPPGQGSRRHPTGDVGVVSGWKEGRNAMDTIEIVSLAVMLVLLAIAWERIDKLEKDYIDLANQMLLSNKIQDNLSKRLDAVDNINRDCLEAVKKDRELLEKLLAEEDTDELDS